MYKSGRYAEAAREWRRAINRGDQSPLTLYNLGTALLAADSLLPAEEALERASMVPAPQIRRMALYNLGLARLKRALNPEEQDRQRAAESAIAAYRSLLQDRPSDSDAKWNYELALLVRKQGSGGGQREQPQRPQQQQRQQQEQRPDDQRQMSRQQAEQLLSAASRDERDSQARKQANSRVQRPPGGKEW